MKKERLQQTIHKHKGLQDTIMNNYLAIKIDNLKKMDRFLEKLNLPRLNEEEIEMMNNPIISTEIEAVIKKKKTSSKAKGQDQMLSQENSIKHSEKT